MPASRRSSEDPLKKRDKGKAEAEALLGLCGLCPHMILVGSVVWHLHLFVLYEKAHVCVPIDICIRGLCWGLYRCLVPTQRTT